MANQIGIGVNTQPGDELLCAATSHVYVWEAGGIARLSGVTARTFEGDGGLLSLDDVRDAIRPADDVHYVRTRLVCLENTHNRGGGRIHPITEHRRDRAVGSRAQPGHASGRGAADERGRRFGDRRRTSGLAISTRSRSVFPRGWGLRLARPWRDRADAIRRARRLRKLFGGGMRQVGIIAAAALYALEHHVDRLSEDHAHAQVLADAFAGTEGFALESGPVETNLVWVAVNPSVGTAAEVAAYLQLARHPGQRARASGDPGMYASRRDIRTSRIRRPGHSRNRAGPDLGDDAGLLSDDPDAMRSHRRISGLRCRLDSSTFRISEAL